MKNLFNNRLLPLVVKDDWRNVDVPIQILIGGHFRNFHIRFEIKNYMLVVAVLVLACTALYGTWQPSNSTYIKNLWVQVGSEGTKGWFWNDDEIDEINAGNNKQLVKAGFDVQNASVQLMKLASPSVTTSDKEEELPIFVHAIADYDDLASLAKSENAMEEFMVEKQIRITKALIQNKASRLDQLSDANLLNLNREISQLFIGKVLQELNAPNHVWNYFTDSVYLRKIETALMEQVKFNVPASIKLAQSALETAYGSRVVHNNYFGIKSKSKKGNKTLTTEFFTAEEAAMNQDIILTQKPVVRKGQVLYECKVQDYFSEYESAWQSFRAHSEFLANNKRYAPLFAHGKKYEDWADKIGSERTGGVGYATSPLYGELLKKIIRRYQLHLLDY